MLFAHHSSWIQSFQGTPDKVKPSILGGAQYTIAPGQGHKLLSKDDLSNMPRQEWMPSSRKPPIHTWLQPKMDDLTKNQLRVAGNVVIPKMAYVAANALAKMANFNLETIDH